MIVMHFNPTLASSKFLGLIMWWLVTFFFLVSVFLLALIAVIFNVKVTKSRIEYLNNFN